MTLNEAAAIPWRIIRTKAHCDDCRRKVAMYTNGTRVLCGFCIALEDKPQPTDTFRSRSGGTFDAGYSAGFADGLAESRGR